MRKVVFTINDLEFYKSRFESSIVDGIFNDLFKVDGATKLILTLFGNGNNIEKYKLTDFAGNKVNINSLNGYEKGVIINDCYAYFEGRRKYFCDANTPTGVIKIEETEI